MLMQNFILTIFGCIFVCPDCFVQIVNSAESGPARGVVSRLGENLEQETQLEDRLIEVLNQQEIKENLDSVGQYVGVIGTGLSAGLGTVLGNLEQVLKSLQRK